MSTLIRMSALALVLAAGPAFASGDRAPRTDVPPAHWLSTAQVVERLTSQGYVVRRIEAGRRSYEVRLTDREGRRIRARVHPASGEIVRADQHREDRRERHSGYRAERHGEERGERR